MVKISLENTVDLTLKKCLKIKLSGIFDEIQIEHFSLYNRGATDDNELLPDPDGSWYCYSNKNQLLKGLESIELARIFWKLDVKFGRHCDSGKQLTNINPAFVKLAKDRAEKRFSEMEYD